MKKLTLLFIITLSISFSSIKAQNWNEIKQVISPHRDSLGEFGRFVDISGNYAIIGAPSERTDTNGLNSLTFPGAAYIYEKDTNGNWMLAQKIIASDRHSGDYFGYSVAICGDYAVVGAVCQDYDSTANNIVSNAGAVYIFKRNNNGKWVEIQKIVSNDRNQEDWFGDVVDISDDYILVGARGDDFNTLNKDSLESAGAAYFFTRNNNSYWVQVQKVVASDRTGWATFGYSVSINGNHSIIGAAGDSLDALGGNKLARSGSAYFFELNTNGVWTETTKITASDREDEALFGCSVSIFGEKAVVGAFKKSSGSNLLKAGAAYVFERNTTGNWNQVQKLLASPLQQNDFFGKCVSISYNSIIVSAHGNRYDASGSNYLVVAGAAFLFKQNNNGSWTQSQKIVASNRKALDAFGNEVSISGNNIVVGAPGRCLDTADANFIDKAGTAYFFDGCSTFSDTFAIVCDDNFFWYGTNYTTSSNPIHIFTDTLGCDSIVTLHLTINSNDFIITQDTLPSNTIKLTAPISDHYQWLDCNNGYAILVGDTNQSLITSTNGSYAVEITRNSCIDTSVCISIVNGINEKDFKIKPQFFPNPTTGNFTIDLGKTHENINIRILDILGRTLKEYSFEKRQSINLDINEVPGVYLLEIKTVKEQFILKIIKE
ncbi:MAG: T9SS type A sorting domain-containing protein [Bacteroidetes bacterium]|nr:T9SS type A sorting domain-containing protein [Bacteroidota bacterium]